MRARIKITQKIKEEDKDGITTSTYYRYTEDDWSSQFKKDFKTMKSKGEIAFHYIEEYPFRTRAKDKHIIDEDEDNVAYGPMIVLGTLRLFKAFRKEFALKPIYVGSCKFIGDDFNFENEGEAPEGNHLAMVGETLGTVKKIRIRQVLNGIKNQLGTKRFFMYKTMPTSSENLLQNEVDTIRGTPDNDIWKKIKTEVANLRNIDELEFDKKDAKGRQILTLIDDWEEKNPKEVKEISKKFEQLQKIEAGIDKMEEKHEELEEILEFKEKLDDFQGQEKLNALDQLNKLILEFEKKYGFTEV